MQGLTVYTTNFNNYEELHDPHCIDHSYVCFTDARGDAFDGGVWRPVVVPIRQETPARENRWYKTHPHELFPHTEWTLYFDASLQMQRCPSDYLEWCAAETGKNGCDLYLFRHPERDCLYSEADACIQRNRDTRERIDAQVARYRQMAFPERKGLWAGPVLLRRNTAKTRQFDEMWWWEIVNGSHRDQISLPVVLEYSGIDFATLPYASLTDWFTWRADHSRKEGVPQWRRAK